MYHSGDKWRIRVIRPCYSTHMTPLNRPKKVVKIEQEHPKLTGFRLYNKHRLMVSYLTKRGKISKSESVRRAIEQAYDRARGKSLS